MENKFLLFSSISISTVVLCYCLLILYFRKSWKKQPLYQATNPHSITVSVVIAVRNEENNLLNCLNSLVHQSYPAALFEIICVDDDSEDESAKCILEFQKQYPSHRISLHHLPAKAVNPSPKKRAIQYGVDQSTAELLLFTDADCRMHENWIRTIVSYYSASKAQLICGPVAIETSKNSFLSSFEQLDFQSLQISGAASLLAQKPLLCNAANLAIPRKTYQNCAPNIASQELASGDDMFLMLAIHKAFPGSVHYLKSKDAMVLTKAQPNISALYNQRKRWASKGLAYNNAYINFVSALVLLTAIALLFGILLALLFPAFAGITLACLALKSVVDLLFFQVSTDLFPLNKRILFLPIMEIMQAIFILIISFSGVKKSYTWKKRTLN